MAGSASPSSSTSASSSPTRSLSPSASPSQSASQRAFFIEEVFAEQAFEAFSSISGAIVGNTSSFSLQLALAWQTSIRMNSAANADHVSVLARALCDVQRSTWVSVFAPQAVVASVTEAVVDATRDGSSNLLWGGGLACPAESVSRHALLQPASDSSRSILNVLVDDSIASRGILRSKAKQGSVSAGLTLHALIRINVTGSSASLPAIVQHFSVAQIALQTAMSSTTANCTTELCERAQQTAGETTQLLSAAVINTGAGFSSARLLQSGSSSSSSSVRVAFEGVSLTAAPNDTVLTSLVQEQAGDDSHQSPSPLIVPILLASLVAVALVIVAAGVWLRGRGKAGPLRASPNGVMPTAVAEQHQGHVPAASQVELV
ncbi:MAG: hypothetical protein EOO65_02615 [Methanosarcinales archaeon]|nr:MAG: hypothetical protein EOO65_02615 [Methanosarcinales archaeon]